MSVKALSTFNSKYFTYFSYDDFFIVTDHRLPLCRVEVAFIPINEGSSIDTGIIISRRIKSVIMR
jgi:hypothetical protein